MANRVLRPFPQILRGQDNCTNDGLRGFFHWIFFLFLQNKPAAAVPTPGPFWKRPSTKAWVPSPPPGAKELKVRVDLIGPGGLGGPDTSDLLMAFDPQG